MKLFLISFLIAVSFVVGCCAQQASTRKEDMTLTVLSYNIHHANPPSEPDKIDLEAIANVINESRADLVGLQEVDVHTIRSGKSSNQAEVLGEMTGMHVFFSRGIDYQGGEYGTAILSRYPIKQAERFELPNLEGLQAEPRTLAVVTVAVEGKWVKFANTHLDYTNGENNLLQVNKILEMFKGEESPIILVGDFNALPDSPSIQLLDQHFTRSCVVDCGFTIPQVQPNRTIDFIMASKDAPFEVTDHEVIDEPYASDHLPVRAVYRMK
jgi:endonuclease/exonuclease/phosphatase family metal-dependent hydrolase